MSLSAPVSGLLLAPGAGAGRDQLSRPPSTKPVSRLGSSWSGIDFPYRLSGQATPDPPQVLIRHREHGRQGASPPCAPAAGDSTGALVARRPIDGCRICSMVVAAACRQAGLVLVSYPLIHRDDRTNFGLTIFSSVTPLPVRVGPAGQLSRPWPSSKRPRRHRRTVTMSGSEGATA